MRLWFCGAQVRNYIPNEIILKRIGCEWDLLLGMVSKYPQTAGKKSIFMHNCEREHCWRFLALEDLIFGQGFLEYATPWFILVGFWYWTTHMGHLGYLASRCSVLVQGSLQEFRAFDGKGQKNWHSESLGLVDKFEPSLSLQNNKVLQITIPLHWCDELK